MALDTADIQPLVQEMIAPLLIRPLEQESIAFGLGVRFFDTATPLPVPRLDGEFHPQWIGENELIPDDDGVGFASVQLLPSTMKSVKSMIRMSNESLRQSSLALESVLQTQLLKDVASKIDYRFFSAEGDGITTPQGLLAWEGTQTLNIAEPSFSVDSLLAVDAVALGSHVNISALKWVMSPTSFSALRGLKYDDGRYVLETDLTTGAGYSLLGHSVSLTDRLADNVVVLGDWSNVAVARDASPTVFVDGSRYSDYDQVMVRVVSRYDFKPLDPTAIIIAKTTA